MDELTYSRQGDYLLPDLTLPEQEEVSLGRYALKRLDYLKYHKKGPYTNPLTTCKLNAHLAEIEQAARNRMEQIIKRIDKIWTMFPHQK